MNKFDFAYINGNQKSGAIKVEINADNGDIIDLQFYCDWDCFDLAHDAPIDTDDYPEVLPHPAYFSSHDFAYCNGCGKAIHVGTNIDAS